MKIHITDTQYYVSFGKTESSDDLPLLMWDGEPSDEMVDAAYRELLPDEYEEVGFVSWTVAPLDKATP
jgi:hypothetical protein